MIETKVELPQEKVAEFCRKWKITEFALFGSVLRDDFRPDSDVDVLVTFASNAKRGLFAIVEMQDELQEIFHRKVHLASRRSVERSHNPTRRKAILDSARVIYVA
jgi:predicted nucleotidyltransferase